MILASISGTREVYDVLYTGTHVTAGWSSFTSISQMRKPRLRMVKQLSKVSSLQEGVSLT